MFWPVYPNIHGNAVKFCGKKCNGQNQITCCHLKERKKAYDCCSLYCLFSWLVFCTKPVMFWKQSEMIKLIVFISADDHILSPPAYWLHWSFMSVRVPAMSVLPPIRKDRVIARLPQVTMETEADLNIKVGLWPHTFVFLSLSVSGKRQLCTQRRILTTKWRRPVRNSVPELWGEDRRDWTAVWFGFRHSIDYSASAFSSFVRFKISKVIVVGDLAVGKTCLINRWAQTFNNWIHWEWRVLEINNFRKNVPHKTHLH